MYEQSEVKRHASTKRLTSKTKKDKKRSKGKKSKKSKKCKKSKKSKKSNKVSSAIGDYYGSYTGFYDEHCYSITLDGSLYIEQQYIPSGCPMTFTPDYYIGETSTVDFGVSMLYNGTQSNECTHERYAKVQLLTSCETSTYVLSIDEPSLCYYEITLTLPEI